MTDIRPYQFEPKGTLQDEDDSDCFEESRIIKESARKTNWCLCELLTQVTSEHLTFLLPALESGIHYGGPPVIWIISLYQVLFENNIVESLFAVTSITYLSNIIQG